MARNFINKLVSCGYVPALSGLLIRSSRVSSILLKKALIIWNLSNFWIVIKNNVHLWDFGVLSARARLSFSKVRPKHFTPGGFILFYVLRIYAIWFSFYFFYYNNQFYFFDTDSWLLHDLIISFSIPRLCISLARLQIKGILFLIPRCKVHLDNLVCGFTFISQWIRIFSSRLFYLLLIFLFVNISSPRRTLFLLFKIIKFFNIMYRVHHNILRIYNVIQIFVRSDYFR